MWKVTGWTLLVGTVVFVVPVEAVQPVTSYKDLKFPDLKTLTLPSLERLTLSNGMTVFLLEDHRLPVVKATGRLRTGSWWEPADQLGVAGVMAEVLRTGGTADLTGDQLDEVLEGLSASIETEIELAALNVKMFALKRDAPRVLGLMAEMFHQPAFDQKKIDLQKIRLHGAISRRNDQMGEILRREIRNVLFGRDHPSARMIEHGHVDRLTRDDVVAFYRRTVSPDRLMLGLWGDFQAAEMKTWLEDAFGGWKPVTGLSAVTLDASPPIPPTPQVWFVDRPDAAQSHVRLVHLGGLMKDPETPALEIANEIFGGGMASRLFARVRSDRGLAYAVQSAWSTGYLLPGAFMMAGETKAETTGQFIDALQKELAAYVAEGPTEDEVRQAKQSMLDALPFHFEDPKAVVERVIGYEYFGYPRDFLTTYMERLRQVTVDDVKRALVKSWRPERLQVLVLGNAAKFDQPLSTFGKVTPLDVSIPPQSPGRTGQ